MKITIEHTCNEGHVGMHLMNALTAKNFAVKYTDGKIILFTPEAIRLRNMGAEIPVFINVVETPPPKPTKRKS